MFVFSNSVESSTGIDTEGKLIDGFVCGAKFGVIGAGGVDVGGHAGGLPSFALVAMGVFGPTYAGRQLVQWCSSTRSLPSA